MRGDYAHFLPKQDNSFGTYSCFRKKLSKTSYLYISSISRIFYLSKYWVLRTGSIINRTMLNWTCYYVIAFSPEFMGYPNYCQIIRFSPASCKYDFIGICAYCFCNLHVCHINGMQSLLPITVRTGCISEMLRKAGQHSWNNFGGYRCCWVVIKKDSFHFYFFYKFVMC